PILWKDEGFSTDGLPNPFFYIFAAICLGSALRVISHPKPVYAALYFILTILSSASLYIVAGAEFMGFALVIIYAGAILITYLFVIMLATQAPSEDQLEALSPYDAYAREPIVSTLLGFTLIAVLTGTMATSVGDEGLDRRNSTDSSALLAQLPRKVVRTLDREGIFGIGLSEPALAEFREENSIFDAERRTLSLEVTDSELLLETVASGEFHELIPAERLTHLFEHERVAEIYGLDMEELRDRMTLSRNPEGAVAINLPDRLIVENSEGIGFALIADHPIALELAGVILLMAMLGAVVLARKQIELTEAEKERAAGLPGDPETGSTVQRGRHIMVTGDDSTEGTPA
ncbi:MAG: NADH-quinone oxidoreductase subunit J, partial [Planctomycetota bacterium]